MLKTSDSGMYQLRRMVINEPFTVRNIIPCRNLLVKHYISSTIALFCALSAFSVFQPFYDRLKMKFTFLLAVTSITGLVSAAPGQSLSKRASSFLCMYDFRQMLHAKAKTIPRQGSVPMNLAQSLEVGISQDC
jgi:hypothetical protein